MVSLTQRMRKLQTKLLAIRLGSGAFLLPKDVKKIHMRFAQKIDGGHMGPRQFWRHELIRLKYHNPAVPMTVERFTKASDATAGDDSATMSIHFAPSHATQTSDSATSSPAPTSSTSMDTEAPDHAPTERVETIDMKMRTNGEILSELVRITNAYPIEPTAEEREELRTLEEHRVRSEKDSLLSREVRERVKREKELLEQARGDMATN